MATTGSDSIESSKTIHYKPQTMSFREYDKKMMNLRPKDKWWELVIKNQNLWDHQTGTDPTAMVDTYTPAEKAEQKSTDRVAKAAYIQGNTGESEPYTDGDSSYIIRQALLDRYDGEELQDLAALQKKYNDVIPTRKKDCPTTWENDLRYIAEKMVKAGASAKTNAEVIAHITTTAPKAYLIITTMVRNQTHTGTNPIRTVIGKYADYWKANFEDAYASEATTPKAGVALAVVTEGHNKAKTWKKYKGSCTYCGKQGHKAVDCHAKARMVAGQRTPTPRNANRNNNNGSHNPPNQGRGGQNRNSQTPRMETRRCNG
jgi:hypothetical protein